jgi:phosphinothricin acetyltransferase
MRAAGWKFERWLDVVIMRRSLGLGDQGTPQDYGPAAASAA